MFFKRTASPSLQDAFEEAVNEPPPANPAAAKERAKAHATKAGGDEGLKPNLLAFAIAAGVLLVLIGISYVVGVEADKVAPEKASQIRDLGKLVQSLITLWSGAALGLIAGEAVGKKAG